VYDVKDQSHCGSCWAFATIGAQASAYAIYSETNPVLLDLSEQNLIDCDTYDWGCNGGNFFNTWDYVIAEQKGNFIAGYSYPYTAV
jgi:C1A family cysteine protease